MKKVQMTLTRRAALTALGASFSSLALFSGKAGASSATTAPAVEAKFPQHFDVERLSLRRKGVDALEPLQMYRDQLSAGRPHVASSGILWNDGEVFAAISGLDQTPASADSGIAVLDETTGEQTAFVAFPDGFFPSEMHRDIDDSVLIAVTETTLGMDQNAVLYRISRA
jgi:hypothetical protein